MRSEWKPTPELYALLAFEKEKQLFSYSYRGVYLWHLVRMSVLSKAIAHGNVNGHPDAKYIRLSPLLPWICRFVEQIGRKKDYHDLFALTPSAYKMMNGEKFSPFTFFLPQMDVDVHYYGVYTLDWHKNFRTDSNNSVEFASVALLWLWRSTIGKKKLFHDENGWFRNIIEELNGKFGAGLNYEQLLKDLNRRLATYEAARKYYGRALRSGYKAVYFICHYETQKAALIDAAHERNIPVIEAQHGVIGSNHAAYNFLDLSPEGKYLPDYLLTFGDYWEQTMHMPSACKTVTVGSPLMDLSRQDLAHNRQDENTVVIYSAAGQTAIGDLALALAEADKEQRLKIRFKLHPDERLTWREYYPALVGNTRVKVIDYPIEAQELMVKAKHHVGIASTTLFQAIALHGRVYVYKTQTKTIGSGYLDDMIDNNCAAEFGSAQQLYQLICAEDQTDAEQASEYLYEKDSLEKFERAVKNVLHTSEEQKK